jgi:hypothetical protein
VKLLGQRDVERLRAATLESSAAAAPPKRPAARARSEHRS